MAKLTIEFVPDSTFCVTWEDDSLIIESAWDKIKRIDSASVYNGDSVDGGIIELLPSVRMGEFGMFKENGIERNRTYNIEPEKGYSTAALACIDEEIAKYIEKAWEKFTFDSLGRSFKAISQRRGSILYFDAYFHPLATKKIKSEEVNKPPASINAAEQGSNIKESGRMTQPSYSRQMFLPSLRSAADAPYVKGSPPRPQYRRYGPTKDFKLYKKRVEWLLDNVSHNGKFVLPSQINYTHNDEGEYIRAEIICSEQYSIDMRTILSECEKQGCSLNKGPLLTHGENLKILIDADVITYPAYLEPVSESGAKLGF